MSALSQTEKILHQSVQHYLTTLQKKPAWHLAPNLESAAEWNDVLKNMLALRGLAANGTSSLFLVVQALQSATDCATSAERCLDGDHGRALEEDKE
jgi:hypothetical protein